MDSAPNEILLHIFQWLDVNALTACQTVCRKWSVLAATEHLWYALAVEEQADHGHLIPAEAARSFRTLSPIFDHVTSWQVLARRAHILNTNWRSGISSTARPPLVCYAMRQGFANFRTKIDYVNRKVFLSERRDFRSILNQSSATGILGFDPDSGLITKGQVLNDPRHQLDDHSSAYLHLEGDNGFLVTFYKTRFQVLQISSDGQAHWLYTIRNLATRAFRVKQTGKVTELFTVDRIGRATFVDLDGCTIQNVFNLPAPPDYVDFNEVWAIVMTSTQVWAWNRMRGGPLKLVLEIPIVEQDARLYQACHIDGSQLVVVHEEGTFIWISDLEASLACPDESYIHRINLAPFAINGLSFHRGRVALATAHVITEEKPYTAHISSVSKDLSDFTRMNPVSDEDYVMKNFLLVLETNSTPGSRRMKGCAASPSQLREMNLRESMPPIFGPDGPLQVLGHFRLDFSGQYSENPRDIASIHIDDTGVVMDCYTSQEWHDPPGSDQAVLIRLDFAQMNRADKVIRLHRDGSWHGQAEAQSLAELRAGRQSIDSAMT